MNISKNLAEAWERFRSDDGDDIEEEDKSIAVPSTITPWIEIVLGNGIVLVAIWAMISILLTPYATHGRVWAGFITLATLGATIASGGIAMDIDDWYGGVVFNPLTRRRRAVFQGLQWKLFWERLQHPLTFLKREVTSKVEVALPTNDPTETMDLEILIHQRLKTSGNPKEDARNLIRFNSVDEEARKLDLEAEVVKMFSSHYSDDEEGEMENLLDARSVQKRVLEDDKANSDRLQELEERYGIHLRVVLKYSNPDERTKKLKATTARAEAFNTARHKLMAKGPAKEAGVDEATATRVALLLDDVAQYSEHRADWQVHLTAEGLEGLRDVNIIPPPSTVTGGEKKGGKKS